MPAAATTITPCEIALFAAAEDVSPPKNDGTIPGAPPNDNEIISLPELTHQSIASPIISSLPVPFAVYAFATNNSTFGAIPRRYVCPTRIPAIIVPWPSSSYGAG